jgi:hypothetical protein
MDYNYLSGAQRLCSRFSAPKKKEMNFQKISWTKTALLSLVVFLGLGFLSITQAASLSVSPASGSYSIGNAFAVNVLVSSPSQSVNAVSGALIFPADKLQITSISKTDSVVNFWVQEPSFSNTTGSAEFEGVILNPGFTGNSGRVMTINFKTKASGIASINYSAGSILANDGNGTNILDADGLRGSQIAISVLGPQLEGESVETTPQTFSGPLAPVLKSSTHPNSSEWYNQKTAHFSWVVPTGVNAVRLLYDRFPNSRPTVLYAPAISEKELKDLDDGIWYFHAQFRDSQGWGSVAHYKFQIDTETPDKFQIKFVDGENTDNPNPVALFNTTDSGSGIAYYKVKVGDGDFITLKKEEVESNPYTLPVTSVGKKTILVQAFDKAGNYETSLTELNIEALDAPVVSDYSEELGPEDFLVIKGNTYPDVEVKAYLQLDGEVPIIFLGRAKADGSFIVVADRKLEKEGVYKMYVEVVDERGAHSLPSAKYTVEVSKSKVLAIGSYAISILSVVVSVLGLIMLGMLIGWYIWKKARSVRRELRSEIKEAQRDIHREMSHLMEAVRNNIAILEKIENKRRLTEEEEKVLDRLKKSFERAEKAIYQEIEEIGQDRS